MTAFVVRHRTIGPWKDETVEADFREQAIQKIIDAAPEDSETEVSNAMEGEAEPKPTQASTATTATHRRSSRE